MPSTSDLGTNPFSSTTATGPCTILYVQGMRQKVALLSGKAQRLYLYILYGVEQDFITLSPEEFMEQNGIASKTTFKTARTELVKEGFITPTNTRRVYWINTQYFSPNTHPDGK